MLVKSVPVAFHLNQLLRKTGSSIVVWLVLRDIQTGWDVVVLSVTVMNDVEGGYLRPQTWKIRDKLIMVAEV